MRPGGIKRLGVVLVYAGVITAGWLTKQVPAAQEDSARPNVLFVMSDEHRWQSMSISDMPELHTPSLERLAQGGMSFDRCISNFPVCSPYRAMLMTGRWPYQVRMQGKHPGMITNSLPLHPQQPTLAKAFKEAGYRTGYIGKWHLGGVDLGPFGFDFHRVWAGTDNHWHSFYYKGGERILSNAYNATHMVDQAIEFLSAAADEPEPFFLMVSMNPPHKEMGDAPAEQLARYAEDGSLSRRPNHRVADGDGFLHKLVREVGEEEAIRQLSERQSRDKARRRVRRVMKELAGGFDPLEEEAAIYRGYHAHISAIDQELGRLLDQLELGGLTEDTIVIYTSDHGSMLGSQGLNKKRFPHEESIRIPFLVQWPGKVPAGVRSDALMGAIDVMPTLMALAGLEVPADCSGLDFSAGCLGGEGPDPASQFLMNIWDKEQKSDESILYRGVRTPRYTYAEGEDGPWLLFDNRADPFQLENRVTDESLTEVRQELAVMTAEWLRVSADPFAVTAASTGAREDG